MKLAKAQAELTRIRQEQKEAYEVTRTDLETGLTGIRGALKILAEYYAKEEQAHDLTGASSGIIGLLEVCESDFSQNLARSNEDEDVAVREYEKVTEENEIERVTKAEDVKYKTKASKRLDADAYELSNDRSTAETELDATSRLLANLEGQCIDRAETFEQRAARYAAEIAGLKEALDTLENETAFLQRRAARHLLRRGRVGQ